MTRCAACGDEHEPQLTLCPRLSVPVTEGPCGSRVDRYDVERFVGGGGFGAVYLARHSVLGQAVAIKVLRREVASSAEVVARFLREARAAASIDNTHVVRVSDFGTTSDGIPFLVMELLAGSDLDALIRTDHVIAMPRAVDITLQALDGLAAAHAAGVIHRDMKPANIVLMAAPGPHGGRDHVKLVDFGLSKVTLAVGGTDLTLTGAIIGTPHYMPPEQFRSTRDVDARADVYAMGVILYQMLSGAMPYDAPTYAQLLLKIYSEPPRPLREVAPALPGPLVDVVTRATAADPEQRFQTARDFADALRGATLAASTRVPERALPATQTHTRSFAESEPPELRRGFPTGWLVALPLLLAALGVVGWLAAPQILPLLASVDSPTPAPPPAAPAPVIPVAIPLSPTVQPTGTPTADPDGGGLGVDGGELGVDGGEVGADGGEVATDGGPIGEGTGVPQFVEMGDLAPLIPGFDVGTFAGMRRTFGRDAAMARLGRIGDGSAQIVSGTIMGSARIDAARAVASLRRTLDGPAHCRAPRGATRFQVVYMVQASARRATPTVTQRRDALDADALTCVRGSIGELDVSGLLPAGTMAIISVELELPAR